MLNLEKSTIATSDVNSFGHCLSAKDVKADQANIWSMQMNLTT